MIEPGKGKGSRWLRCHFLSGRDCQRVGNPYKPRYYTLTGIERGSGCLAKTYM